jgi:hypothetical protein
MNWFRKHAIALGGTAVAVSLLTLTAPRAAHALVVALVQVTNTVATPAITQDVSKLASQSVELACFPGQGCGQILPNGSTSTTYFVPTGSSLVITTVQINTTLTGSNTVELLQSGGTRGTWVLNGAGTFEFQYPSGIAISSGQEFLFEGGQNGTDHSFLIGYLVSN